MSQWRELFKIPTDVMARSMGAIAHAADEMQGAVSDAVESFANGSTDGSQDGGRNCGSSASYARGLRPAERAGQSAGAQNGGAGLAVRPPAASPALVPSVQFAPQGIGFRVPPELDLADDMVKLVKYDIVYTKPDEEHCIQCGVTELVNYNTRADQLSAVLIARYAVREMAKPGFVRNDTYDEDNLRYWRVSLRVQDRFAKEEAFYDRRQARAMERIAAALGG